MSQPVLAPVYLDNEPVALADPRPKVAQILAATGRQREVTVLRLRFIADSEGRPLHPEETIDRTVQTSNPVYLRTADRAASPPRPSPPFPLPSRPAPPRPGGPMPRPPGPLPRPVTARDLSYVAG